MKVTVIVPYNVTVYIPSETGLIINIQSLRIYGTLQIGSGTNLTFTFKYSTNIMIFSGGRLEDLSLSHQWFVSLNTIFTIYKNGSFISSERIQLISISTNTTEIFNSLINGPYTITIDLQGIIKNYSCKTNILSY